MTVYGIYEGNFEGSFLKQLYFKKEDALKGVEELVAEKQKRTEEMQEFCKKDKYSDTYQYNDWRKDGEDSWVGDYDDQYSIYVQEVEII